MDSQSPDLVNNPPHYKLGLGEYEVIDVIKAVLTPEEFRGYLKGNAMKYLMREQEKGAPVQDMGKQIWHAQRYQEELKNPEKRF